MKKCWVYNNFDFNFLMAQNNWNDNNIPDNCAFISICEPNYQDEKLGLYHWFSKNRDNIINLDFYDIDSYKLSENESIKGLSDKQAEELYQFIENNLGKDFYIHCAAGMSRSQGVAKYITDTYFDIYPKESLRIENPCEFPNLHVVSLLKHIYFNKHLQIET